MAASATDGTKLTVDAMLGSLAAQQPPSRDLKQNINSPTDPVLASSPRRQRSIRRTKGSVEDLASRAKSQESKRISPDTGSLGRGGRQFTVGNVGNNGRIYLRYDFSYMC